jgi:hypothetical protein
VSGSHLQTAGASEYWIVRLRRANVRPITPDETLSPWDRSGGYSCL